MVIYSKEEKTLIIPEGLGYEAEQQYNKGYDNGYNKGFKDGSDGHDMLIRMRYYLDKWEGGYRIDRCLIYLPNWHNSITMNGFDFYCDEWDNPMMQPSYNNMFIRSVVAATNIPDNLTFTFFCLTSARSETNPLPTKDDFDILTINEENYVADDVTYEYIETDPGNFEHWYCTFTCHKEEDEQNDNNEE